MNIIELQERLKDLPEQALMQEMQAPSGTAPQFLVLSELKRRKRMRDDYQRQQAQGMKTVAEEAVTAAGAPAQGIMQMSRAMAPKSAIAQNTGVNDMMQQESVRAPQPEQPMMMADGGYVQRMREGGFGDNLEYAYAAFLQEMGLSDTPDARDAFRRYQDRMNVEYALEGPNADPALFMRGVDRAPQGISIADVDTDIGAFMPGAGDRRPVMGAAPVMGDAPSMGAIDFDASIAEAPAAPPPLPDTLAGSDLMQAAAAFSGPSDQSRAALALRPEDVLSPFGGAGAEIAPSVGDLEYGGLTDPREVTQGERPEFVGDVLDYLRGLGADAPSQIGGYEFTPEEMAAMDEQQRADTSAMDDLARQSAEEAARLREEMGITDARESIGAGIVEDDQAKIDRVLDVARNAIPVGMDTGTPLQIPEEGAGALLPPRQAPQVSSTSTPSAPSAPSAPGGYGPIESRIARMLEEREKSAEADKWLALAQTGLALMASKQPTIGGAIGEAGLAGIGAMQKARSQYDKDVLSLLNAQAGIQRSRAAGARAAQPKPRSAAEVNAALDFFEGEVKRLAKPVYGPDPSDPTGMAQTIVRYDYSSVPPDVMNSYTRLRDQYLQMFQSPVDVTS